MASLTVGSFAIRRTRLISGTILFVYVTTHLVNHSLGVVSLEAMEHGRTWFIAFWQSLLPTTALYGALVTHFLLALWAIFARRRLLAMPAAEALQLALGLAIVPLLTQHVLGTRVAHELFDLRPAYAYVLGILWFDQPHKALLQGLALLVAWVHGCIGLYFWLRLKPWYGRWQPYLYAGALLLPVVALLGFADTGREVARLAEDEAWYQAMRARANSLDRAAIDTLITLETVVDWVFYGGIVLALAARVARFTVEKSRGLVRITYPDGREARVAPGVTVLEASQQNGIPHASVCGGRGRCSTCRVRIAAGAERLPPPSQGEQTVLARVGAPPGVRLACQLRPTHDIAVVPLIAPGAGPAAGFRRPAHLQGQERDIAILFCDLRGFTQLSERRLPYDVVYVLNRYFAAMGQAIERSGGHVDKFIGDGVMALFGIDGDAARGCRQALAAAREMSRTLDDLNRTLTHELERPLKIGIGIHVGPVIVGEMGYARTVSTTAIGDAVNTASRLEALTKDFAAELVVSDAVAARAGVDLAGFPAEAAMIRGRAEALQVRIIARAQALPETLPGGVA